MASGGKLEKTTYIQLRTTPEVKEMAEKMAKASGFKNTTAYIENLIKRDALRMPSEVTE